MQARRDNRYVPLLPERELMSKSPFADLSPEDYECIIYAVIRSASETGIKEEELLDSVNKFVGEIVDAELTLSIFQLIKEHRLSMSFVDGDWHFHAETPTDE